MDASQSISPRNGTRHRADATGRAEQGSKAQRRKAGGVKVGGVKGNHSRLSESVYESLVQMIVSGQLEPGQPISELELSRRLEVSRTPIHEAIHQLVKDGLVAQLPNRRPVVVSFSREDVFDVYEMRRILESEAAARAATRLDRPTLERLAEETAAFETPRAGRRTIERWVRFDDEFHRSIATASGSRRLAEDIQRYRLLHRVFNRTHTDPSILVQAAREHQRILTAFRARDPEAARVAMQQHLQEWQRFFVLHLASELS